MKCRALMLASDTVWPVASDLRLLLTRVGYEVQCVSGLLDLKDLLALSPAERTIVIIHQASVDTADGSRDRLTGFMYWYAEHRAAAGWVHLLLVEPTWGERAREPRDYGDLVDGYVSESCDPQAVASLADRLQTSGPHQR